MTRRLWLLLFLLVACSPTAAGGGDPLYPDLRALPPTDLLPSVVAIDGVDHYVLRFTAAVVNVGRGPLELRGDSSSGETVVYQRVYDTAGQVTESLVGTFGFHEGHDHWHFEHFADYELWTWPEYERWVASGGVEGEPGWRGSKTTGGQIGGQGFCLRDSQRDPEIAAGPTTPHYGGCATELQGISAGWLDVYPHFLPDQWVDLGDAPLADGTYVLRIVADPQRRLREAPDPAGGIPAPNEAVTSFTVQDGCPDEALLALARDLACGEGAAPRGR